ncbi:Carboxymethylenebutenolidase [Nitrosotalea sinensis]|uniref:Carboxymethylenebutenolidase n=1 Tax=Nitrosotalea sinensis TaxID=1499975 RepID=A0A2H1EHH8_9ARCH|nr:dienelactone hydrolase family protein [Candidatus Nitrosotalea sinensis]SHO45676.1 Carboxymethylenebutenolidase [Candidatus Nitrosotalea sinensis]
MQKKILAVFSTFILILAIQVPIVGAQNTQMFSPIKQMNMHVPINQITCAGNLQIVMKKSDGSPACIKSGDVSILIERGWAVHLLPDYTKNGTKNSDMFEGGPMQVTTSPVTYYANTTGYVAMPSQKGNFPGVILIHEWWGLNDNIKSMARGLASHGYVAMAVDLYAGQVATTADGARQLLLSFDEQKGMENINAAANILKEKYNVTKISTIGWCFGGSQSLNYALSGNKLDATIIYYGQPVTNTTTLSSIKWPILGFFGEKDQSISINKVREFKSDLDKMRIQNEIYTYPGLGHAFANPSGANYAPEQTKDAWNKTLSFMDKYLK